MTLLFQKIDIRSSSISNQHFNSAFLRVNDWDDYSFKSLFYLTVFDERGVQHSIGNVKIGYIGQTNGWTEQRIPEQFESLGENFFSLGQDAEYYQNIKNLSSDLANNLLNSLRDIAYNKNLLASVKQESVFSVSLLRTVSLSAIHEQYKRILTGGELLTDFNFSYVRPESEANAGIQLDFQVIANSKPSTNIHILIGRNGVGKTTLLNDMVSSIVDDQSAMRNTGGFYQYNPFSNNHLPTQKDYFSSVVSVSFSAFDPFIPPFNRADRSQGTCYFYIGLKKLIMVDGGERKYQLKDLPELGKDFADSLHSMFKFF